MSSYLQKDVLSSKVTPSYFFWAPLKTAFFNFSVAYSNQKTAIEQKIESIALESLSEQEKKINEKNSSSFLFFLNRSFVYHAAVGILLIIPGVNLFPFCYLVIKAKEEIIPPLFEDNKNGKIKKEIFPKGGEVKKKEGVKNKSDKNEFEVSPLDTPLIVKPPKLESKEVNNSVSKIIITTSTTQPIDIPVKTESRVANAKEIFEHPPKENNFSQSLINRNSPSSPFPHSEILKFEEAIVVKYLLLFPDDKMESEIKTKTVEKDFVSDFEEKSIVEKLLLKFPGHTLKPKLENADKNLDFLRNHLKSIFGEEIGGYPIQEQYSSDLFVPTDDNPSEHLRISIFSHDQEAFKELLDQLIFEVFHDVIHVKYKE